MIESGKGQRWLVIGLTALTILIGGGSILAGETAISAGEVFDLILSGAWGEEGNAKALIIFEIRLPRILLAGLIGCTLGLCGAALQGLLRNPLADPGLIGVSASASLGAVIAMYFGLATVFPMATPWRHAWRASQRWRDLSARWPGRKCIDAHSGRCRHQQPCGRTHVTGFEPRAKPVRRT